MVGNTFAVDHVANVDISPLGVVQILAVPTDLDHYIIIIYIILCDCPIFIRTAMPLWVTLLYSAMPNYALPWKLSWFYIFDSSYTHGIVLARGDLVHPLTFFGLS